MISSKQKDYEEVPAILRIIVGALCFIAGLTVIAFTVQDAKLYYELWKAPRFAVLAMTFVVVQTLAAAFLIRLGFVWAFKFDRLKPLVRIMLTSICGSIFLWRLLVTIKELQTLNWQMMSVMNQLCNGHHTLAPDYLRLSAEARAVELMLDFANNGWKVVAVTLLVSAIGVQTSKRLGWSEQTTQASHL